MKPTISVIIPVYNVEECLRACIDSVLAQTYPEFEVICVDDGSTDNSSAILDLYATMDGRVNVIHQSNGGMAVARNAGIEKSSGELIYFMDSDDVISPSLFNKVYELNKINQFEFLCFDAIGFTKLIEFPIQDKLVTFEYDLTCAIPEKVYERGIWQCVFRKSLLGDLRFPDGCVRGEDRLFLGSYLIMCSKGLYLACSGYGYRHRQGSSMLRALTEKTLSDELWFRVELVKRMSSAQRMFDGRVRWRMTVSLLEWYPAEVFKLPTAVWQSMYEKWRSAIRELDRIGFDWAPWWRRFLITPAVFLRSILAWRLFCALPHFARNQLSGLLRKLHLKV